MALWKSRWIYFKRPDIEQKEGTAKCLPTLKEIIKADEAVAKAAEQNTGE